jgi:hypothetical protein
MEIKIYDNSNWEAIGEDHKLSYGSGSIGFNEHWFFTQEKTAILTVADSGHMSRHKPYPYMIFRKGTEDRLNTSANFGLWIRINLKKQGSKKTFPNSWKK